MSIPNGQNKFLLWLEIKLLSEQALYFQMKKYYQKIFYKDKSLGEIVDLIEPNFTKLIVESNFYLSEIDQDDDDEHLTDTVYNIFYDYDWSDFLLGGNITIEQTAKKIFDNIFFEESYVGSS